MITVDTIGRVRRAYFVQGRKIKAIARELRLARNTVREIVRAGETGAATERRYRRAAQPLPQLGAFVPALEGMLAENGKRARRERLTYQRMFEELKAAGYAGGYDNVRRYARQWAVREGERIAAAFVPLIFAPGEAYQFDWSHEIVMLDGVAVTVKAAQVRLCHSRMLFVRAYPRETQEMVFDAHEKAFAFFKGVPRRGIYDNMATAVNSVFVGKERQFNLRFLRLMSHHLVEPTACTPAAGWEKGQVENQVGVVRKRFFSPRPSFKTLEDLNGWHARRFGRNQVAYDPWHYVPVLARKPGALRNGAPFKDWPLPGAIEKVRRRLAGTDDGDRQMVKVLTAVLTDGLSAVEAACAEALSAGLASADVVLNALARRQQPAPSTLIAVPERLALKLPPVADCARYDALRAEAPAMEGLHGAL